MLPRIEPRVLRNSVQSLPASHYERKFPKFSCITLFLFLIKIRICPHNKGMLSESGSEMSCENSSREKQTLAFPSL